MRFIISCYLCDIKITEKKIVSQNCFKRILNSTFDDIFKNHKKKIIILS